MASNTICLERDLLKSEVFRSLSKKAILVYFDFRMKCRVQRNKAKPGRQDAWHIINNGEIEYTYSEAEKKGIPRATFMRSIDQLIKKCNKIQDFYWQTMDKLDIPENICKWVKIQGKYLEIRGICQDCLNR